MNKNTTKQVIIVSAALIALGGLGLAFACNRLKKRKNRKNIAIQII